jgi:sulfur carrier protein
MQIFFNGAEVQCADGCTLATLLDDLGIGQKSCATAVNSRFIARDQRGDTRLVAGDHIMTFEPITGG